eukprot:7521920-Alexandrium_andersonii.AAC.1
MSEYGQHLPAHVPFPSRDITGTVLQKAARRAAATAGGADGWQPAEIKMAPLVAMEWLACMFNKIGRGAKWPSQLRQVRCCWLAKTMWRSASPLQFRGLLVMSAAYRLWAK